MHERIHERFHDMTRLVHTPPLPRVADMQRSFLQHMELRDGRQVMGEVIWHLPEGDEGVVQIVELWIHPQQRRAGHAGKLLLEAIAQAKALCKLRRIRLRRFWMPLEQKTQVMGRSFLTRYGFHHTSTIPDLLRDQDVLVYVRSFD